MPINLTQSCFQQIKNTFSLTNREHQPSNSASTNSGNNDGFRIEHEKQRQTHLVKDNPQLRKLFSGKPINPNDEPAVFFKKGADNEGSSTILVRKLENLTESRIVSAELKKENVISGKMSELQAHALWQADKAYWPLISNNNKDNGFSSVSFYYPSESFQSEIDGIVSKKIPGLDLTYKEFFNRLKSENPTTEIIITGGLVRDTIYNMTNNGNIEPSDVDIQVTVRNDQDSDEYPGKTIQQIAKNVLTELAQKKYGLSATPEKIKTFIDDHFLEKSTGYVGIGHCKEDDFLDIFNANTFVLKASDTPDYTANSAFYRYSEEEPFLFSKSKMALTDAINSQLRLTKNWFDAVKSFVNKPAEILRYIYFRCQKGYKASQDDGLTRYAILAAITQLVKISQSDDEELKKSKEGGQYFEHLENIKSGNRLGNGTVDHGNITTETDIARVTDKFFMKKFNTPSKAMDALRFLRDDHIHYTPELLAFAEIIKALLDDVDQTGLYKNESEQLIKDIKKEVEKGTAKADVQLDHTVPLIDLFDLMSEITSGLPQDSCIKLKSDLNKMVVDTGKSLDFAALKTIVTNCQSDSIDKAVQDKIDYFTLCMDQLMDQSIPQITRYEAQTWV